MKILGIIFLLAFSPSVVLSHPGKTDLRGGHKCWKGCAEWELYYGEYHLHDKDFIPIRVERDKKPKAIRKPSAVPEETPSTEEVPHAEEVKTTAEKTKQPTAFVQSTVVTPYDESSCSFTPLQLALSLLAVFLLIMLLIIRVRRPRGKTSSQRTGDG